MSKHFVFLVALTACVGGSDEPAPVDIEDVHNDIGYGSWCGAVYEDVGLDELVDGFDATPAEALASIEGSFSGDAEGTGVQLVLDLDDTVQVARVTQYESEDSAPAEAVAVWSCSDHLVVSGTMDLSAGDLLAWSAPVDIAYHDGEDAGDGFGWDTANFSLRTDAWSGDAQPSWDPEEMEVVEMVLNARWSGGEREGGSDDRTTGVDVPASIWNLELSFWGESKPTGTGPDSAVWAGEEMILDAELRPDAAE